MICFCLDGVHGEKKLKKETVGGFFFLWILRKSCLPTLRIISPWALLGWAIFVKLSSLGIKYFIIRAHILYKLQAEIIRVLICICLESVYDGNKKLWAFFFYEYIGNHVYQLWESFLLENSGVEQSLFSCLTWNKFFIIRADIPRCLI